MRLKLSGSSDDIISLDFDNGKSDEMYIQNHEADGKTLTTLKVTTIGGSAGCLIHVVYDGCWSFAVGKLEDGRCSQMGGNSL